MSPGLDSDLGSNAFVINPSLVWLGPKSQCPISWAIW
jgi:hypothetical protein